MREVRQGRAEGRSAKKGGRKRIYDGTPVGTSVSPSLRVFFIAHSLLTKLLSGSRERPDKKLFLPAGISV